MLKDRLSSKWESEYSSNMNLWDDLYVYKIIPSDDSNLILQKINVHTIPSVYLPFSEKLQVTNLKISFDMRIPMNGDETVTGCGEGLFDSAGKCMYSKLREWGKGRIRNGSKM